MKSLKLLVFAIFAILLVCHAISPIQAFARPLKYAEIDPTDPGKWSFKTHNGSLEYIPIGIGTRQDLLIVVHNETGKVFLEDFDFGTFEEFADSLEALIRTFQPSKQTSLDMEAKKDL